MKVYVPTCLVDCGEQDCTDFYGEVYSSLEKAKASIEEKGKWIDYEDVSNFFQECRDGKYMFTYQIHPVEVL